MQIRPGRTTARFVDRCAKQIDECVIEELSDGLVLIGGEAVHAIFEIEAEKVGYGDGPESTVKTAQVFWLSKDNPNVRSGDRVVLGDNHYTIKKGFPMDLEDCWLYAELNECGGC